MQESEKFKRFRLWDDVMDEHLQDPHEAAGYLSICLEEGDQDVFLLALRNIARARGGVGKLAAESGLNREHLYRMLSKNGNPRIKSLAALLDALGLQIAFEPKRVD